MSDPTAPLSPLAAPEPNTRAYCIGRVLQHVGAVAMLTALPVKLNLCHISLAVLALGTLLTRSPIHRGPGFFAACAFAALQILSIAVSPYEAPIHSLGMIYIPVSLYLLIPALSRDKIRSQALIGLHAGLAFTIVVAFLQYTIGHDGDVKPFRISSAGISFITGLHPTHLSYSYLIASAVIASFAATTAVTAAWPAWLRHSRWPLRLLGLITIPLAGTRSVIVGLAAAGPASQLSASWKRRLITIGGAGLLILVALAAMWLFQPERFERTINAQDGRWDIWRASWAILRDHPWFGTGGSDAFTTLYDGYHHRLTSAPITANHHAHNSFLGVATEHGIFALLAYCTWLITLGVACWRQRHEHPTACSIGLAALALCVGAGMFEHYAGDSEGMYGLCIVMALALAVPRRPAGDATLD
jgi:O-antigen ligase